MCYQNRMERFYDGSIYLLEKHLIYPFLFHSFKREASAIWWCHFFNNENSKSLTRRGSRTRTSFEADTS